MNSFSLPKRQTIRSCTCPLNHRRCQGRGYVRSAKASAGEAKIGFSLCFKHHTINFPLRETPSRLCCSVRRALMQHSSECSSCCLRRWRLCETQDGGARKLGSCLGFSVPGRIYFLHQALPVDISPSEDDPHIDTASRVDAAVALSRLHARCLRTWRISMTKKQWTLTHSQLQCPCASPSRGYCAE